MEREFRFRAWNRIVHRMQEFTLQEIEAQSGKIQWQNLEIMQYVGLKDKNGKEIYEDDVVKDPGGNCLRVIWNQDACEYQLDHEDGMHSLTIECTDWTEVIGNIYSNPELINKATS